MHLYTARPSRSRRWIPSAALLVLFALWYTLVPSPQADAATPGVSGHVWEDRDGDGRLDADEATWGNHAIELWTADGSRRLTRAITTADGRYAISPIPEGRYLVKMATSSWWNVRDTHHPTTLPDVWPEAVLDVTGPTTFDLGWRTTQYSREVATPLSSVTTADGVRVDSYTDAVHASRVAAALEAGLAGGEAPSTRVRFGLYEDLSYCGTSIGGQPGSYGGFTANCHVSYEDWVYDRHATLFHEYGHAWAKYHLQVVNQTDEYTDYLEVRGLADDSRLGSSHAWSPGEMIAEDYRQLFGTPAAAAFPQENSEIPVAAEVPGLAEYLAGPFMHGGAPAPEASPEPEPSPEPTSQPSPEPTTEPSPEPTTEPTPEPMSESDAGPRVALSASTSSRGGDWTATVTAVVTDSGAMLSGTVVRFTWTADGRHGGDGSASCTTDGDGRCAVSLTRAKRVGSVTFTTTAPATSSLVVTKP